jgi:hypothetical protein
MEIVQKVTNGRSTLLCTDLLDSELHQRAYRESIMSNPAAAKTQAEASYHPDGYVSDTHAWSIDDDIIRSKALLVLTLSAIRNYRRQKTSAALKRARSPFLYRNAFTGLGVLAFIGGVYVYSIQAVKQEDFVSGPCPPAVIYRLNEY